MTTDTTDTTGARAVDAYAVELYGHLVRLLGALRPRADDALDIAGEVVTAFLAQPLPIMARYTPLAYASSRARHGAVDHDRRQRAQRGEGVRLHREPGGGLVPGRRGISGDAVAAGGGECMFATLRDPGEGLEDTVVARRDDLDRLQRALGGVPASERAVLYLVDGMGWSVVEVARARGLRRETVSRRLSRTRGLVAGSRGERTSTRSHEPVSRPTTPPRCTTRAPPGSASAPEHHRPRPDGRGRTPGRSAMPRTTPRRASG